jgi:hypothetical protein
MRWRLRRVAREDIPVAGFGERRFAALAQAASARQSRGGAEAAE